uniref:Helicase-associated domain-containing protein n=1 Tax=Anopheles christyi TaxID=43041 RepID=A0A182JWU8_9DIPT
MDIYDFRVMQLFLNFVRDNAFVWKVRVEKKIGQYTVAMLQNLLECDPSFRNIWMVPTENDDGVIVLRIALGGEASYSLATEDKLKKMNVLIRKWENAATQCHSKLNSKPLVLSVPCASWTFWSVGPNEVCHVPPSCRYDNATSEQRCRLPVGSRFGKILQALSTQTSPIIICGGPDSGKRTEIVHYIMENCHRLQEPCRTVCALQEEVEVIAAAKRVCKERNELAGNTIGYKLSINSQVCEMNNVVFCTIQTLILSLLQSGQKMMFQLTHLVVDNVDRPTREMNLLLSLLKEKRYLHPTLKLVLLSSGNEGSTLSKFFDVPQVMHIPHNPPSVRYLANLPHGVEYHYLEEILAHVCTHEMIQTMKDYLKTSQNPLKLTAKLQVYYGHRQPNRNMACILDLLLNQCWFSNNAKPFTVLLRLLSYNMHLVDYQHTNTRMSALMIAGAKGYLGIVRDLLAIGANPYVVGRKSLNALDWCIAAQHNPCWQIMNAAPQEIINDVSLKLDLLCQLYRKVHNPYIVDHHLVVDVVAHICNTCVPGKILVMLPDFMDVLECYEMLQKCLNGKRNKVGFVICHRLLTEEELNEFMVYPKEEDTLYDIILMAGPLLELVTSLGSIDYVVDTGLKVHPGGDYAKGLCIDGSCMASIETARTLQWLAQRKCFMLYPKNYFDEYDTKVGRKSPCTEEQPETVLKALLCRFQSSCSSVEIFLDTSLIPANSSSISKSLELLDRIGVITRPLKLPTSLGLLLVHLNVGIHLGKALLYSVLFKCLDPILTIVAAVKIGNPFIEPLDAKGESELMQLKFAMHNRTYSDCMVVLRLYQQWSQSKTFQTDGEMVQNCHLKVGYMEALSNTRVELMSVLRLLGIVKCGRAHNTEELNINSNKWVLVKGCLAAGLYPQLAIADYENNQLIGNCAEEIFEPHPLSVAQIENLPAKWVVYITKLELALDLIGEEVTPVQRTPKTQICDNSVISDWTLLLMCGVDGPDAQETGTMELRKQPKAEGSGQERIVEFLVDRKYSFRLPDKYYRAVLWIRCKLGQLFRNFTQNPLQTLERKDTTLLVNCIGEILQTEDASLMLGSVSVDTRPKIRNALPMGALWNYAFSILDQSLDAKSSAQTSTR